VVLLFEDEGIGAAIVEAGRLVDGAHGTAGELGHCAWPGAEARCGCGRHGCVETLASGPAVRRTVERATGRRVRRRAGEPTFAALARRSEPEVAVAAGEAGRVLGTAASWLTALTAPRMVVLSGSLVLAPVALRTALAEVVRDRSLAAEPPLLVAGALGDGAALRGAVLLALDEARRARRL
jgi:glucokinase